MRPKEDGEDSEEIGTKIPQNVTSMSLALQPKCKREDFKHWQPWLKDENLPKWAENFKDKSDLKTLLTKDSKEGAEALQEQVLWW